MREAAFYQRRDDGTVECRLCPHHCRIADEARGRCQVRENRGGMLVPLTYGRACTAALDPIEKKPLYHFHPGARIVSVGSWGCNMRCLFCQNWSISQQQTETRDLTPDDVAGFVAVQDGVGVAYTYNEPLIQWEFVRDCAEKVRRAGGKNVLVTNGFVEAEPLEELLPWIDAMNVDIKAFREDFYNDICGAALAPVLRTVERAARDCHVETTTLIIPGRNDDPAELDQLARWVAEHAGPDTPAHLSAYTPRYKLKAEPTTLEDLLKAREVFQKHLRFVYLGNVISADGGDTRCPGCGAVVVARHGYHADAGGMAQSGACKACGTSCGIVTT